MPCLGTPYSFLRTSLHPTVLPGVLILLVSQRLQIFQGRKCQSIHIAKLQDRRFLFLYCWQYSNPVHPSISMLQHAGPAPSPSSLPALSTTSQSSNCKRILEIQQPFMSSGQDEKRGTDCVFLGWTGVRHKNTWGHSAFSFFLLAKKIDKRKDEISCALSLHFLNRK